VKDLIKTSARRQINLGEEDLAQLIADGDVLIGVDGDGIWCFAAFHREIRPSSLRAGDPDRVYLRAAAFQRNTSPSEGMRALVDAYCARVDTPLRLVIAYGAEGWFDRALEAAGLELREQVYFYALDHLERQVARMDPATGPAVLRLAAPEDIGRLAMLDAETFDVVWHMSQWDLRQLLLHGRLELAFVEGQLAGYSATTFSHEVAQLARLAVHPSFQRSGLGRQLLVESLKTAEGLGCTAMVLNTQAHNMHAQELYRSVGFHQTGEHFGVFTRLAGAKSALP
jgi:[ribosomal protein S18]-alanine N-acetyltransferase